MSRGTFHGETSSHGDEHLCCWTTSLDDWRDSLLASLASFFALELCAAQLAFMVGDIATALMRVVQDGGQPLVFAVVAGGFKRSSLPPDVSASGKVGAGRQHAARRLCWGVCGSTLQAAVCVYDLR